MAENPQRSPLKAAPLRTPGQSIEAEIRRLAEDGFEQYGLFALLWMALTAIEWWRWYAGFPPQPVPFSIVAAVATVYAGWRLTRVRRKIRALRLGLAGERAVGQFLERLRTDGYEVFHDVIGDGFNLDHVVIGPAGVLTIETKTWSKPLGRDARIRFDGETLVAGSMEPDRNPVIQAKAQASWLRRLLEESTGKTFAVRPVIVFPGWFVEQSGGSTKELWVLEPKALPSFLAHESRVLSEDQIKLASFHLSRFIRAQEGFSWDKPRH